MKKELSAQDYQFISQLAEQADLVHDGGEDNRVFLENTIDYNVALMSKEQFQKLEEDLKSYSIKGKGFEVYGWNDGSGYNYWRERGESGDLNYIQITAVISEPQIVNIQELRDAMSDADIHFSKWDNLEEQTRDNTSLKALVDTMKLVSSPEDVFDAPALSQFSDSEFEKVGLKLIETLFCDQSGFGASHERALTKGETEAKVKELIDANGPMYAAITGVGQFQIYVSLFKKTKKRK